MRLAARPVGAHSNKPIPFAASIGRMALTMVVLPTPGPPVTTKTFVLARLGCLGLWVCALPGCEPRNINWFDAEPDF
jgi:hypothetical protein